MTTLLIHLSDVHLDAQSSSFVERANKIVASALSSFCKYTHIHVVISGDLANRDAPRDFQVVRRFIALIESEILGRVAVKPLVVIAPGNHDADFSEDQSVRDILVEKARQSGGKVSPAVFSEISKVLDSFAELQRQVMPGIVQVDAWHSVFDPKDGSGINYLLLNSPVLSMKKEDPGKLFFPIDAISPPSAGRTIVVMHHPLGWFSPDNAREIAQAMPSLGQLVLMGHEHVGVGHQVKDIYDGTTAYYLRASVLREPGDQRESAFQTVEIDPDVGFLPRSFRWQSDAYALWAEKSKEETIAWPRALFSGRLSISPEGLRMLRAPGASYTHRRKDKVTLEDIFVWPNLRRQRDEAEVSVAGVDRVFDSKQLAEGLDSLPRVVVVKGGEQAGKSALARMLALHTNKRGKAPLLLCASAVSSWREKSLEKRLEEAVKDMYGPSSRDAYKQLDPKDRVLIVDDFDLNQVTDHYFDGLRLLRQQFGKVVLMLDSHPGMEVALSEFLSDENFTDSEVFDLLPSTAAHRLEIIEQWLRIGDPEDLDRSSAVKLMAAKLLKVVDETLGRNLIPSLPVFVLIVLQRAETEQDLDTVVKSGSHGFLYESMIRQALSSKVTEASLVTAIAYLTAFAGACDARGVDGMAANEFQRFHFSHCERFELAISQEKLLRQLIEAEVLDNRTGVVRFRYPFHYYYFLAKALKGLGEWGQLEPRIDSMVAAIHTEKNANVLLFLAHLGRDERISQKILVSAKRMFEGFGEGVDLFAPVRVLTHARLQDIRAVILEGGRHDQLEDRSADERRDESASRDLTAAAEARLKHRLDDALRMNAAFKTLQVLGQVLRNHAGEIERAEKQEITEACVALGLRVLQFIFETVSEHESELISFRAEQVRASWRKPAGEKLPRARETKRKTAEPPPSGPTEAELAEELAGYLPGLVSSVTVGTLIKIANAIGCEDLSPTIDHVLGEGGTRRLIRLATKLEHFSDFPSDEVLSFNDEYLIDGGVLPNQVLRRFLVRRFHLFPVRDELKRSVLDRFGISAKPFLMLPQKGSAPRL